MASHFILFLAVISITTGGVAIFKNVSDDTQASIRVKQDAMKNVLDTDFNIDLVAYNSSNQSTTIYARNAGETKFKISEIDVYMDNVRIERDDSLRWMNVTSDTDVGNADVWDENEVLQIRVWQSLSTEVSHEVAVLLPNGVKKTEKFST